MDCKKSCVMLSILIALVRLSSVQAGDFWAPLSGPTGVISLREMAAHPNGDLLAGFYFQQGASRYGTAMVSRNMGQSWTDISEGLPHQEQFAITGIGVDQEGRWIISSAIGGVYRRAPSDSTWVRISPAESPLTFATCLLVEPGKIFAGVQRQVYRSTDHGQTWEPSQTALDLISYANRLIRTPTGRLLVGGGPPYTAIFYSDDDGLNWHQSFQSQRGSNDIWGFAVTPNGTILATVRGDYGCGIFRSIDDGLTWTRVFDGDFWRVIQTPDAGLFAGRFISAGDKGEIYQSLSDGQTWGLQMSGIPAGTWSIQSFALHPSGYLFVGTENKGIYRTVKTVPVELSRFYVE